MSTTDLDRIFRANQVPLNYYAFSDKNGGDCYVLEQVAGMWEVYYSERGNKFDVQRFATEDEACHAMFALVKRMMESSQHRSISLSIG